MPKPNEKPDAAPRSSLPTPQTKVLASLAESKAPMTYKDIEEKTGYYSTLTKIMRAPHEGSLVSLGYAKEVQVGGKDERKKVAFLITPEGRKALKSSARPAAGGAQSKAPVAAPVG